MEYIFALLTFIYCLLGLGVMKACRRYFDDVPDIILFALWWIVLFGIAVLPPIDDE